MQELLCLTGAWDATGTEGPRWETPRGDSSWPLTCPRRVGSSGVHSAIMLVHLRRAGRGVGLVASNYSDRLEISGIPIWYLHGQRWPLPFCALVSHLIECMLGAREEAQHWGDGREGDMPLSWVCSHLAAPAITSDPRLSPDWVLRRGTGGTFCAG